MRALLLAAVFAGSPALADESAICAGWALDRKNFQIMMDATEGFRAALRKVPKSDPSGQLAENLIAAMSVVLDGANGAFGVTGELNEEVCPSSPE
jgi:hypothetical protein